MAQTKPVSEILVVDDGSQDATASLVESYAPKVKLISQPNSGVSRARNLGIDNASGDWIAFLDSDDSWEPEKLEFQIKRITSEVGLVYTDAEIFDPEGAATRYSSSVSMHQGKILPQLVVQNFITTSSVLAKRSILKSVGCFPEHLRAIVDWPVWLKIAAQHEVAYIDRPLVKYTMSAGSITRDVAKTLPAHLTVLDEAFTSGGVAEHLQELRKQAYGHAYRVVGCEAARSSQWAIAIRLLLQSACSMPADVQAHKLLLKTVLAAAKIRSW